MKTFFLIVMTSMLFCSQVHGESFKLLSAEIPPFTSETREAEGFCIDLARELFKRSGIGLEIQFFPWARAQHNVRTAPEGKALLITPLTRVAKREAFDGDPKELIRGIAYPGRALYLAASKGTVSKEVREKLQRVMEEMKSNGTYDAILGKYMN